MNSIVPALFAAFEAHGLEVKLESGEAAGVDPDAEFARAWRSDGTFLHTGAGLALTEIQLLEGLLAEHGGHCLVVGNGFGWSAVALGLILDGRGRVVVLDACVEGEDGVVGIDVTNAIAREHGLDLEAVRGASPSDVPHVVASRLDGRLDIVLVDSLHTDEQQAVDYEAIRPYCHTATLVLFHDVVNWRLTDSFAAIAALDGRESLLLHGTPSGMGVLFPSGAPYAPLLQAFAATTSARKGSAGWQQRYLDVSRTYLAAGEDAISQKYLHRALAEAADPVAVWVTRAWQSIGLGRLEACADAVAMARAYGDDSPTLMHVGALVARAQGATHDQIWSMLAPYLTAGNPTPELLADAAAAALGTGDARQGLEIAARAAAIRPSWALPHYLGALAAQRLGASAEQVAARFANVVASENVTPAMQLDAARALLTAGDTARATDLAERVIKAEPDWALPWHLRGLAARASGAPLAEVGHWFEMALQRPPVSGEIACDAAFVALELGHLPQAESLARLAVGECPEWSVPWHLLALIARARGESRAGEAPFLRRAAAVAPISAELAFDVASLLLWTGEVAEAERHAAHAATLQPEWTDAAELLLRIREARTGLH
jgi:tetratricopeptide (TPR) repeat protein